MAKTVDFPSELRHFVKVLNSFRGYWYDYDIFRDFIDYTTASLLWEGDKELADRFKRTYKDDYPRFGEMFLALVETMRDQIADDSGWYDALGELYEAISSRSKASFLGQFFTPPEVCDLMAKMQVPEVKPAGKTVNDPACGSGRLLLAFNSVAPANYLIGQDMDAICTKMTAINMALHGCTGQALNGDSLRPDHFAFGFEVNSMIHITQGLPHLLPISREQSVAYQIWHNKKGEPEPVPQSLSIPDAEPLPLQKIAKRQLEPGVQLSIF